MRPVTLVGPAEGKDITARRVISGDLVAHFVAHFVEVGNSDEGLD
jgi:hypothetical protein